MTATTEKPKPKPRKAKALNVPLIEKMVGLIGSYPEHSQNDELERRVKDEGKAKIEEKAGMTTVDMAGVAAKSPGGLRAALSLWANAARRAAMRGNYDKNGVPLA